MISRDQINVIPRCRELCQQFMVEMYVKIKRERFRYLRFNQNHVFRTDNYTWRVLEPSSLFLLAKDGMIKNIVHYVKLC
jgi:hypothetical protein